MACIKLTPQDNRYNAEVARQPKGFLTFYTLPVDTSLHIARKGKIDAFTISCWPGVLSEKGNFDKLKLTMKFCLKFGHKELPEPQGNPRSSSTPKSLDNKR